MANDRIQKLRDKKAQLEAQIRDLAARDKQQQRKNDTRRKVIIGALALEHMEKNSTSPFAKTLWPLLDEYVTRPQDRELLNDHFKSVEIKELPPRPQVPANDPVQRETALKSDFPKSSTAKTGSV